MPQNGCKLKVSEFPSMAIKKEIQFRPSPFY